MATKQDRSESCCSLDSTHVLGHTQTSPFTDFKKTFKATAGKLQFTIIQSYFLWITRREELVGVRHKLIIRSQES